MHSKDLLGFIPDYNSNGEVDLFDIAMYKSVLDEQNKEKNKLKIDDKETVEQFDYSDIDEENDSKDAIFDDHNAHEDGGELEENSDESTSRDF